MGRDVEPANRGTSMRSCCFRALSGALVRRLRQKSRLAEATQVSRRILASVRYASRIEILLLCTANLCRSPMAEAVLLAQLAQRDLATQVRSAGFLKAGQHPPPEVAAALARWGLSPPSRSSREVSAEELRRADLVLCMERAHVREAAVLEPSMWPRIFTLKELVRRASDVSPRTPEESIAAWLARIHAERDRSDLLGSSPLDDIADPYGKKVSAYEATLTELAGLTGRLIELIWPPPPGGTAPD